MRDRRGLGDGLHRALQRDAALAGRFRTRDGENPATGRLPGSSVRNAVDACPRRESCRWAVPHPISTWPSSTRLTTSSYQLSQRIDPLYSSSEATPDRPSGGRFLPSTNSTSNIRNQVEFLVVYITEAHPSDVWQMQSNVKDKVVFASPQQ